MKNIVAIRDGITANFHPNTWATMPEDKYGWEEVRQAPEPPPPVVAKTMQAMAGKFNIETKQPRQKRVK